MTGLTWGSSAMGDCPGVGCVYCECGGVCDAACEARAPPFAPACLWPVGEPPATASDTAFTQGEKRVMVGTTLALVLVTAIALPLILVYVPSHHDTTP